MFSFVCLLLLVFVCDTVLAQDQLSGTRNFLPRAYPLAVRSPYFNSWYIQFGGSADPNNWPVHSADYVPTHFTGLIRVDGERHVWLGGSATGNKTILRKTELTPTRTIFTIDIGTKVELKATFLSPIEPDDLVKQSFPFSYIAVDIRSLDGQPHSVQVFGDMGLTWLSTDSKKLGTWSTVTSERSVYHEGRLQSPSLMSETRDFADDSTIYVASRNVDNLTWETGAHLTLRNAFQFIGKLGNMQDQQFRALDDDFPILANAFDLGTITSTSRPLIWALGMVRDPAISLETESGPQLRRSYFWTKYSNIADAINDFLDDYEEATDRAVALDKKIMDQTQSVSDEYTNIVSLTARQTMAVDVTVSEFSKGNFNTSDVQIFMKDSGVSRRVNPVEVLYAALPAFLYLNPSFVAYALEPLLQSQSSTLYTNNFAASDLGTSYPIAAAPSANAARGLETTSTMMIMVWAHAIYSGNGYLLKKYTPLLQRWSDYLMTAILSPNGQSIDGIVKNDSTNLLLGAALGLHASAKILSALNIDSAKYSDLATSIMNDVSSRTASANGHFMSTNNPNSSPTLIYNMYADKLLKLSHIGSEVYDAQSTHYSSLLSSSGVFGLPVDGSLSIAKPHWTMFAAASCSAAARDALLNSIHLRMNNNTLRGASLSTYDVNTGDTQTGGANPALGATFAVLALNLERKDVVLPRDGGSRKNIMGAVAGGVVGGVVFVALLFGIFFFYRRRRAPAKELPSGPYESTPFHEMQGTPAPFAYKSPSSQPSSSHLGDPVLATGGPIRRKDRGGLPRPTSGTLPPGDLANHGSSATSPERSGNGAARLRHEVDDLRRELAHIRTQHDLPPGYNA